LSGQEDRARHGDRECRGDVQGKVGEEVEELWMV
jgi:hypothetical protein